MKNIDENIIRAFKSLPEKQQFNLILNFPILLRYTTNTQLQIDAVKKGGFRIGYIDNPSERVQMTAVKNFGTAIQYIKNPTEKVQIESVKTYPFSIQFIENPSEQVQPAAVEISAGAITHIDNPTEKVQMTAITKYGYVNANILLVHREANRANSSVLFKKRLQCVQQSFTERKTQTVSESHETIQAT